MSEPSPSSRHRHDNHDWGSSEYVSGWAEGQDKKEHDREAAFNLLADTIPFDRGLPIKILDVGAGYGALTRFLLGKFPNATALCQDGSQEMIRLGHERMASYGGRFTYVQCDFSRPGWSQELAGPFQAVVSAIAIHNVRDPKVIRAIYEEIFPLVENGGCFLNFDRLGSPLKDQIAWLEQAGFAGVKSFWQDERRCLFGGFKRESSHP